MISSEIKRVAMRFKELDSSFNETEYENQLHMIYGAIYQFGLSSPKMFDEMIGIEQERIKNMGNGVTSRVTSPASLVSEYAKIAFFLAQKSFETGTSFEIAKPLGTIFDELIASGTMTSDEISALRTIVSETRLDYMFAAGNHSISSLRMAHIIRESKSSLIHPIQKTNGGKTYVTF